MVARVDATDWSAVVWCKLCPEWSRLANDEAHAHDLAVLHESQSHPQSEAATLNRWRYRQREARAIA